MLLPPQETEPGQVLLSAGGLSLPQVAVAMLSRRGCVTTVIVDTTQD